MMEMNRRPRSSRSSSRCSQKAGMESMLLSTDIPKKLMIEEVGEERKVFQSRVKSVEVWREMANDTPRKLLVTQEKLDKEMKMFLDADRQ